MKPSSPTLIQILKMLEANNYIAVKKIPKLVHRIEYGAFGTHLRENIFHEWKSNILQSDEITVFPINSSPIFRPSKVFDRLDNLVQQYLPILKLRNNEYPFGIAMWTDILSMVTDTPPAMEEEPITIRDLWRPLDWTVLTCAFFCSSKQSVYWFDRLHRFRLRWWKGLSRMPSSFTFNDVPNTSGSEINKVNILFHAMGEILPVETIHDFGPLPRNLVTTEIEEASRDLPHLIVCETSLDSAVLTYLLDAFQESDRRILLRLRHKLVPFKVSIVYRDLVNDKREFHELINLANYISKEMHKKHLSVFSNACIGTTTKTVQNQLIWFDELGIPYVIILDKRTLKNGIVGLRNRDTTLEEEMHLSDLSSALCKYL